MSNNATPTENKPEPKPVPTTPRGKLLAHFDEILEQLTTYNAKFDGHIHAMEEEQAKILESRKQLLAKIAEVSALRKIVEDKVK